MKGWSYHKTIKRERSKLEKVVRELSAPRKVLVDDSNPPIFKRDRYGNITLYSEVKL